MITTPGMDGILSDGNINIDDIQKKVKVSYEGHSTSYILLLAIITV